MHDGNRHPDKDSGAAREERADGKGSRREDGDFEVVLQPIENGKRRLTAAHVEKIARALGVPVSEIYGEAGTGSDVGGPGEHLRPVNAWRLRKKLEPVLGDRVEDFIECFQMWIAAPEQLKRALRAFSEESEKPDAREEDNDTPER